MYDQILREMEASQGSQPTGCRGHKNPFTNTCREATVESAYVSSVAHFGGPSFFVLPRRSLLTQPPLSHMIFFMYDSYIRLELIYKF